MLCLNVEIDRRGCALQENDDNELVTEKIVQLMGEENQHLFPQLVQLISCEQTAYGN